MLQLISHSILFYPKNHVTTEERRHKLKKSLSEALTRFYPFSGRIENNTTIECDDNGVPCIEAQIHSPLSSFLQHPDMVVLKRFLPIEIESLKAVTMPLLLVQLNFFDCGGLAIGLRMSHRSLGLRLPPIDFKRPVMDTKRYVFNASKIVALKAEAVSPSVQRHSRTEAVTALLWKCAMAAKRSNSGVSKNTLVQFVNVRKRVDPSLPENSIGNLILASGTTLVEEETEREMKDLVAQLRKGIAEFDEKLAKELGGDDSLELI
ncbi:hypothetical protein FEM48_Zijuj10G0041700 [Ziziphus jujuba var. spinosa]|uniref:Vinorine synthase-like n=1 Tax=Ziziphus jujuba var. spinosa TaxID=714518 RepID=A0A978UL78_ZIZJJ|nr:hypothetical protein FEM48_Zijuj10G0041700 [Ziziphus jujuba var. spinosa]